MDQRTRKLMIMHKALHPRDDIDRTIYIKKGRGKRTCQHWRQCCCIDTTIWGLHRKAWRRSDYTATRNNTDNMKTNRITITRKQKWEGKQLYGYFKWIISNISHEKKWTWLRKENFKRETESLLIATQNAIRTNHIKARIDKIQQNSKWRLCGNRDKTINHIISDYSKLAQKENKTRHN